MINAAILLCAGSGTRMGGAVEDKVLVPLGGEPVVLRSFDAFARSGKVQVAVIVYRDHEQRARIEQLLATLRPQAGITLLWTQGGAERQNSVYNALVALGELEAPQRPQYVFIHDCARPMLRPEHVDALLEAARADGASVLASRVADTIKRAEGSAKEPRARHLSDIDRSDLWAMQTPQAFARELITAAYAAVIAAGARVTDDTAAAAAAGHTVTLVENRHPNPKLTTAADLPYLEFLLRQHTV